MSLSRRWLLAAFHFRILERPGTKEAERHHLAIEYYSLAVAQLRAQGRNIPDAVLTHISPAHSENINFFGVITVDVDAELAKLDDQGLRPLRPLAAHTM